MVRVLFLVAPYKKRMIEEMSRHFSSDVVCDVITPQSGDRFRKCASSKERIASQFVGPRNLRDKVRNFGPDVVYSDNTLYSAQFKLSSFFARERTPIVLHLRGDWWREYWAWFAMASWKRRIRGTQQYTMNWAAILAAKKVTPICRWLDQVIRHHAPSKNTEVVYQGVEPSQFFEEEAMEFEKPAIAIIQNHAIYPKTTGLLNFRTVIERLPHVKFYIAEGEPYAQTFLQVVKEHYAGLLNVRFVKGIVGPAEVRRMLTAADSYVLASNLDCCPTTVLEASLMRRPVIVSKVGGVPEIVRNNRTGWTIDNSDTDRWVQMIELVTKDRKLRQHVGANGREWVSKQFGWKTIAAQVERLLTAEAA